MLCDGLAVTKCVSRLNWSALARPMVDKRASDAKANAVNNSEKMGSQDFTLSFYQGVLLTI